MALSIEHRLSEDFKSDKKFSNFKDQCHWKLMMKKK